jgi:A/G-specific adenine glycosylase
MKYTSISPSSHQALREALLGHYDRAARDLPWRKDTDPYRVLVSEIMLQQTRVETVKGYYGPWLERFPSIEALAAADEDAVLKAWEGLGYYRRARNLHRAARVVREDHGGELPVSLAELRGLPGVGEYTAGAVASIAFGEAVPAVDGNVRRVFARLFDVPQPKPAWLRKTAEELVDEHRPGDWNQALMELGATICTPRSPKCDICPVARWCAAGDAGTVAVRPIAAKRRAVPSRELGLLVLYSEGRVLLEKRQEGGLLGGLWAFPETDDPGGDPGALAEALGLAVGPVGMSLPDVRQRSSEHGEPCLHGIDGSALTRQTRSRCRSRSEKCLIPGSISSVRRLCENCRNDMDAGRGVSSVR